MQSSRLFSGSAPAGRPGLERHVRPRAHILLTIDIPYEHAVPTGPPVPKRGAQLPRCTTGPARFLRTVGIPCKAMHVPIVHDGVKRLIQRTDSAGRALCAVSSMPTRSVGTP